MKTLKNKASLVVEDTANELEDRKEEYEMVSKQYSVFKSIMSIIKGDSEEFANFTYAMDSIGNTIYSYLGEMDTVINESNDMIDNMKVECYVISDKTKMLIEKYDNGGLDSLFKTNVEPVKKFTNNDEEKDLLQALG